MHLSFACSRVPPPGDGGDLTRVGSNLSENTNLATEEMVKWPNPGEGNVRYYRKRGSASYIVREVLSVRERERERDTDRQRETEVTSPLSR